MKLVDFHLHSNFSSDSAAAPRSIIERAIALNLSAICITDHNDFDYPLEDGKTVFNLDLEKYFDTVQDLAQLYADRIKIYTGVEQGLTAVRPERIENYASGYTDRLDFIIGSSHMVYGTDPYYKEFWEGKSANDGVLLYLESILDNLKVCSNFDVYGHIDYINRYIPKESGDYDYRVHMDLYTEIFKRLIEKGKGIEINTSGFKYGLEQPHPCLALIRLYKSLGGEIITIGSDAHAPQHVGYAFEKVPALLKTAGFDYYTVFEKRQPRFCKIQEF